MMSERVPDAAGVYAFVPVRDLEYEAEHDGKRYRVELVADVVYVVPHALRADHAAELEDRGEGRCLRDPKQQRHVFA